MSPWDNSVEIMEVFWADAKTRELEGIFGSYKDRPESLFNSLGIWPPNPLFDKSLVQPTRQEWERSHDMFSEDRTKAWY